MVSFRSKGKAQMSLGSLWGNCLCVKFNKEESTCSHTCVPTWLVCVSLSSRQMG